MKEGKDVMLIKEDDIDAQKLLDLLVEEITELCRKELAKPAPFNHLYNEAWDIVNRGYKKALELGVDVVLTVVDQTGQVILTYRMEDALLVSNDMSYKKAYTAVGMKMQSKDLAPLTQPGQWLYQLETMTDNKIVSLAGGIPIFDGARLLGAIGVSGGTADQDQTIATFAVAKFR